MAAGLVVVVGLVVWLTRHRPDPRVRGRWQFTVNHPAVADEERGRIIDFQEDGWVWTYYADGRPVPRVVTGRWWVEGDQLVLLSSSTQLRRRVWNDLQHFARRITRQPEAWDFDRYQIVELRPEVLRLRFLPHQGQQGEVGDCVLSRPVEVPGR